MTFFGLGGEDWVELDLDANGQSETAGLLDFLSDNRDRIEVEIGPFEIEVESEGVILIIAERSYRAQLDRTGRVMFTGLLDPDGPL